MTPDEKHATYMEVFEKGQKHSRTSPETTEKLNEFRTLFEAHVKHSDNQHESTKDQIQDMCLEMRETHTRQDVKLDSIDKKIDWTNGQVAKHTKEVNELEKVDINISNVLESVKVSIDSLGKKFEKESSYKKVWLDRLLHGLVYAVFTILGWLLLTSGIVNPNGNNTNTETSTTQQHDNPSIK